MNDTDTEALRTIQRGEVWQIPGNAGGIAFSVPYTASDGKPAIPRVFREVRLWGYSLNRKSVTSA